MIYLLAIPLVLQGVLIFLDEFVFHHRRGLPKWEIWGHPMDTISILVPFAIFAWIPYQPALLWWVVGLCLFSSVFVTKDEFVHSESCEPIEHWLHAVCFILHPIVFFAAGYLWTQNQGLWILQGHFFLASAFLVYRIIYWGHLRGNLGAEKFGQ